MSLNLEHERQLRIVIESDRRPIPHNKLLKTLMSMGLVVRDGTSYYATSAGLQWLEECGRLPWPNPLKSPRL